MTPRECFSWSDMGNILADIRAENIEAGKYIDECFAYIHKLLEEDNRMFLESQERSYISENPDTSSNSFENIQAIHISDAISINTETQEIQENTENTQSLEKIQSTLTHFTKHLQELQANLNESTSWNMNFVDKIYGFLGNETVCSIYENAVTTIQSQA